MTFDGEPCKLQGKRRSMSISHQAPFDGDEALGDGNPTFTPLVPDLSFAHKAMIHESFQRGLQQEQQREQADAALQHTLDDTCSRRDEMNRASQQGAMRGRTGSDAGGQLARQESKRKKFSRAIKAIFVNDQSVKSAATRPGLRTQPDGSYQRSFAKQLAEYEEIEDAGGLDRYDSCQERNLARM